jgi:hypothetical protein
MVHFASPSSLSSTGITVIDVAAALMMEVAINGEWNGGPCLMTRFEKTMAKSKETSETQKATGREIS